MLARASGTAILQAVSNGLGFVGLVILARALGRDGYGVYALALAWAGFLSIPGIVGFDRFLVRGLAVYELRRQKSLLRGLLRRTNQIVFTTSVAVAAAAAALVGTQLSPSLRLPFATAMLLVPLTNLTLVRQAAMQALRHVVRGLIPEYLIRPVLIVAAIGAVSLIDPTALTATSAIAINIGAVVVAFTVGAVWLRRVLLSRVREAQSDYQTRAWVRRALPMMLVSGIWTANNYAAILIVGTLGSTRAAGVYNVVDKGASMIALLWIAVNLPLAPAAARLHAAGDRAGLERVTVRMARAGFLASLPIVCALAIFPTVYLGLFGRGFEGGATALTILALGQLLNMALGPAGNVLMMTGNERMAAFGVGVGFITNVIVGVILVPLVGITGAAIGETTSLVTWNVILLLLARRRVGINASVLGRRMAIAQQAETA